MADELDEILSQVDQKLKADKALAEAEQRKGLEQERRKEATERAFTGNQMVFRAAIRDINERMKDRDYGFDEPRISPNPDILLVGDYCVRLSLGDAFSQDPVDLHISFLRLGGAEVYIERAGKKSRKDPYEPHDIDRHFFDKQLMLALRRLTYGG
ncbi:MAG: hypothetical protein KKE77_13400 [Alphaproteobacteria bacterium]|uniref:Uncharacterized protein n=1 Tax=viral metagenome TaxID=1070528 RepID=A0A6M3XIJ2_9ZZZZ|nr:hypothetical protein [Alphaproteobacteria bacterium]MBU2342223.1 hypothetical protein [Alphaproteobacteria bacterium]